MAVSTSNVIDCSPWKETGKDKRERAITLNTLSLFPYKINMHTYMCSICIHVPHNKMNQFTQVQLINKHTLKNQIKRAINKA